MSASYDEYEVIDLLQDKHTVKQGFSKWVAQYSQPL